MPKFGHYRRPTISGPKTVRVGPTIFHVPASSEFRRVRIGGAVYGYVLANGAVHVLDERGEVAVPAHYRAAVGRKYFGLASGAQPGVEASSGPPEVVLSAPGNDEFMAAFGPVRE